MKIKFKKNKTISYILNSILLHTKNLDLKIIAKKLLSKEDLDYYNLDKQGASPPFSLL